MNTPSKNLFVRSTLLIILSLWVVSSPAQTPQRIDEKAAKYHAALKNRPGSGYLFERFYNAWLDSGTLAGLETFLTAEDAGPGRSTADALILGLFQARQGNDAQALETLSKALEADPAIAAGWLEKARILARNLDFEEAIAQLDRALEANPKGDQEIEMAKFKARLLVRSGKKQDALLLWKKLLSDHAGDEDLHEDLVELQIDEGLFEEAIESLQELMARPGDPYRNVMRQLRVGDVYQRMRKRDQALAAYEAALGQTGSDTWIEKEILAQIEQVYRRKGDFDGLSAYLETLASGEGPLGQARDRPMRPALVQRRARILIELQKPEQAVQLLADLLARTPGNLEIRESYVDLLRKAGELERAISEVEQLIAQHAADNELLIKLADLQHEAHQTDQALTTLETYLAKSGQELGDFLRVAQRMEAFGKIPEAEATYRAAIAKYPDDSSPREIFASFLLRTGKQDEAVALWKELTASGGREDVLRAARTLSSRQANEAAFAILKLRYEDLRDDSDYLRQLCEVAIRLGNYNEATDWAIRRVQRAERAADLESAVRDAATILIEGGQAAAYTEKLAAQGARTDQESCLLAELFERQAVYDRVDTLLSGDSELLTRQRMRILKRRGDWTAAAHAIHELIQKKKSPALLRELVTAYRRAERPGEAMKWIPEWKAISPGSIEPWLDEVALTKELSGDEAALKVLEMAGRKFTGNEIIRSKLAEGYSRVDRLADARRIFTSLYEEAETMPDRLRWISPMASTAKEEDTMDLLIQQFEERRRNNRGSVEPLLALAEIHRVNFDYAGRRKALMEASELRSQDVELILQIARVEEREGQWKDALKSLERARALEDSPRIIQRIAILQLKHGEDEEETYRRLNDLAHAADADTLFNLAVAVAERRDWRRLKGLLSTRVESFPADYRLLYLQALALEELAENEAAAAAYLRVLGMERELPRVAKAVPPPSKLQRLMAGVRTGTSYGKKPPGLTALIRFSDQNIAAYQYRRGSSVRGSLPTRLDAAHGLALAHLSKLKERLDDEAAAKTDRQIGAVAGQEALMFSNLQVAPDPDRLGVAPLDISAEMLNRYPDNLALHAFWLRKNAHSNAADFETYQACFRLFKDDYPGYAIQAATVAAKVHPDQSTALLEQALPLLDTKLEANLALAAALRLFDMRKALKIGEAWKQTLETKVVELFWARDITRLDRVTEQNAFFEMVGILGVKEDPATFVKLLEDKIADARRWNRDTRYPYLGTFSQLDSNLIKPLEFPPPDLHRFPWVVLQATKPPGGGPVYISPRPTKEQFETFYAHATDPLLKFLIANRLGRDDAILQKEIDRIEKDSSVDRLAKVQLLASWHTRNEDHAEVVRTLETGRRLPMSSNQRWLHDIAMVSSAIALDQEDSKLASEVRAGRNAAKRIAANSSLQNNQRPALIGAMRALGMETPAEEQEQQKTSVASITQLNIFGYRTTDTVSGKRIDRAIKAGDKEAAAQLYVALFRSLIPAVFNVVDGTSMNRWKTNRNVTQARKHGVDNMVLEFFQSEASKSDVKQLEYAGAALLLEEEEIAVEQLKTAWERHPKNTAIKVMFAIMLIKSGQDPKRIESVLTTMSKDELRWFVRDLNEAIPSGSVPLKDELRLHETLLGFVENHEKSHDMLGSWLAGFLNRLVGDEKKKDGPLGRLYQTKTKDRPAQSATDTQRWRLHDRYVELLWEIPELMEHAYEREFAGALYRGLEHDPVPGAKKVLLALKDLPPGKKTFQDKIHGLSVPGPAEVLVREAFRAKNRNLIDETLVGELRGGKYGTGVMEILKDLTDLYFADPDSLPDEMYRRLPSPKMHYGYFGREYGLSVARSSVTLLHRIMDERELPMEPFVEYLLRRARDNKHDRGTIENHTYFLDASTAREIYLHSEELFFDYMTRLADIYCRPLEERKHSKPEYPETSFGSFLKYIEEQFPDMKSPILEAKRRAGLITAAQKKRPDRRNAPPSQSGVVMSQAGIEAYLRQMKTAPARGQADQIQTLEKVLRAIPNLKLSGLAEEIGATAVKFPKEEAILLAAGKAMAAMVSEKDIPYLSSQIQPTQEASLQRFFIRALRQLKEPSLAGSFEGWARDTALKDLARLEATLALADLGDERALDLCRPLERMAKTLNRGDPVDRKKGAEIREEILALTRNVLGPEHRRTLEAMNALAISYDRTRRIDKQFAVRSEALEVSRKVHGPKHPTTLLALLNLGSTCHNAAQRKKVQKQHEEEARLRKEAVKHYEEAAAGYREVKGLKAPLTLTAIQRLAMSCYNVGQRERALALREELLDARRALNGPEHAETLAAMKILAGSYEEAGRKAEATALLERVQELRQKQPPQNEKP